MNQSLVLLISGLCCFATACFSQSAEEQNRNPQVRLKTNKGDITLTLYEGKAPETVANFLSYVKEGHYDGTVFHRVITDFMIQGGGFDEEMNHKATKKPIKNEADNGVTNKRGTIAMARTADVNSATAQFFINVVDNPFLNHRGESRAEYGYCVFGEVTDGMDVVDIIRHIPTKQKGMHQNVPVEPVVILKAELI